MIALRLTLTESTADQRIELASEWAVWLNAFVIACLVWALVSILRAPLLVRAEDAAKGTWVSDNRFVFYEPLLAAMFRCKATGNLEMFKFRVPFVEPGAFIDFSLQLDPDVKARAAWDFGGTVFAGPIPAMNWPGTGGVLLPADRTAVFRLSLLEGTVSTTARVYIRSYTIGDPSENDGSTGNFRFPSSRPAAPH